MDPKSKGIEKFACFVIVTGRISSHSMVRYCIQSTYSSLLTMLLIITKILNVSHPPRTDTLLICKKKSHLVQCFILYYMLESVYLQTEGTSVLTAIVTAVIICVVFFTIQRRNISSIKEKLARITSIDPKIQYDVARIQTIFKRYLYRFY